jgi:hypothetical protein
MLVRGARIDDHVAPPSVVRTIAGQRLPLHGILPRTQPSADETNVADIGSKPAGTALPCGFGDWLATAAADDVGAGDGVGVAVAVGAVVLVGDAPTFGGTAPGRARIATATMAIPTASRPKAEANDPVDSRRPMPLIEVDGSRLGISDTRATRRSGAGSRARPSRVARSSRWNFSSSFIG